MPPDLVKLMLSEVNVAVPAGPGVEAGMVVLVETDAPRRRLRIVIAQPEARAIQGAWTGVIPVRPSTWDLFVSAVAILEGRIDRVVIRSVQEERHFFADLELERDGERRTLSCRPSDAVAVALRAYGAEIYAAREVMDAVGLAEDGTKYGPYVKPGEPASPTPPAAVDAGVVAETPGLVPEPTEGGDTPARGAGRTRSGRLPRKASPRTPAAGGTPVRKAAVPVKKAGTPAGKAGVPAKKAGAPVRKRTPPPR